MSNIRLATLRIAMISGAVGMLSACVAPQSTVSEDRMSFLAEPAVQKTGVDPARLSLAISEAKAKRAKGHRVWCVPFARTASGVQLRGNAGTWWKAAQGVYARGKAPRAGAVMAFASTRKMPLGHVAVVSEVVSDRKVLIDHANWERNKISLKMAVIDISPKNDWSKVKVEYAPGRFGSVYPVHGFIYPTAAR